MKKIFLAVLMTGLLGSTSMAQEAVGAQVQAAPAPAPQMVPVYQMGANNQMSPYPIFYVLHGQYAPGQVMVAPAAGAAPAAAAGTTPAAAAGAAPAAAAPGAAAKSGGLGIGKILNPQTMINSAVQGAVQGAVNKAIDN